MSGNIRKTGLEINEAGNFSKKLDGHIAKLHSFDKAFQHTIKGMNKIHGGSSGKGGVNAEREQLKLTQMREKHELQIAGIKGKEASKAEVERQREQASSLKNLTARERLNQITQKGAADAKSADEKLLQFRESKISKLAREEITYAEKITQMRAKGARDEVIGSERVIQAKARTIAMEERLRRQEERRFHEERTADEHRALGVRGRLQDTFGGGNLYGTGQSLLSGSMGVLSGFEPAIHAAAHVNDEQTSFRQLGLGQKDNNNAFSSARRISTAPGMRGVSEIDALESIKDLHNVTKNLDESIELAPKFSRFMVASKELYHASSSQVMDMAKAAEMGAKGKTPTEFRDSFMHGLELQTKIQSATQGRLKGNDFLNFQKMAGMSRFQLTDEAKIKLAALSVEQGGSRTGQSLMTLDSALLFGSMTPDAAKALSAHHLVMPGGLKVEKGKIKGMKAGGLVDSDLMARDPFAWQEKHFRPIVDANIAKYGKEKGEMRGYIEVGSMLSARNSKALSITGLAQGMNIQREIGVTAKANGIDASYSNLMGGYHGANIAQQKSYEKALVRVGEVALPIATSGLNKFAAVLERFTKFSDAHPTATKVGVWGVGGAAAVGAIGGIGLMIKGAWNGLKFLLGPTVASTAGTVGKGFIGAMRGVMMAGIRGLVGVLSASAGAVFSPIGLTIAAAIAGGVAGYFAGKNIGSWIGEKVYGSDQERDQKTTDLQVKILKQQAANRAKFPSGPWAPTPPHAGVTVHVTVKHDPNPSKTTATATVKPGRHVPAGHIPSPIH
jgi:hypothetical protein